MLLQTAGSRSRFLIWHQKKNAETQLKLDPATFCGTKHPQKLRELHIN
jgi:hypothetical protein